MSDVESAQNAEAEDQQEDQEEERQESPPISGGQCPNCGADLQGMWCYNCGQSQKPLARMFWSLISEAFDDVFSFNSRTAKTLFALLFRPGFLTTEYFAGRRVRYIPPLRLYIISSIAFFFLLSITNFGPDTQIVINGDGEAQRIEDLRDLENLENLENVENLEDLEQQEELRKAQNQSPNESPKESSNDSQKEEPAAPDSTEDGGDAAGDETETVYGVNIDEDLNVDFGVWNFDFLSDEQNETLNKRLDRQGERVSKLIKEDPGLLGEALIDTAPPVIFLLLPIFAFLLKLFYIGSGRYYTEHFVLAVHNHSFLFIILIVDMLFVDFPIAVFPGVEPVVSWLGIAIAVWIPLYMYLSLKEVYDQGTFVTIVKYCLIGFTYNTILMMALALAFIFGMMTL